MLSRVGLVGDIHAEDELLSRTLAFFAEQRLERVLAVGDVVDGRGSSERTCELLLRHHVITVRGNHDRWILGGNMRELPDATPTESLSDEARRFLSGLPLIIEFPTPRGQAMLCHGLGTDDMAQLGRNEEGEALLRNTPLQALRRDPTCHFILNGHTHAAMVRNLFGVTVINAGTLRRGDRPGLAVIDFCVGSVELFRCPAAGGKPESVATHELAATPRSGAFTVG